ncbi:hypothetical protein SAMN05444008_10881 [Cnuella takakiae]|uniref:Uncharacterized protein n=1 Tax=Cnuella takakiae TaxID=1302690 RepID=A0A1M5BSR1_9BACT|nr:hypothetical protein [Cnuella takakiae]OLY93504.1 hypothetical protein BUE76_17665 [Cnuella takakiae]SHF45604.1 hypothetical protein SAMN05444008_10881 [Cnuella takakiae]
MKNDDPIKKLLANSTEGAPPNFLQSVMNRVQQTSTYVPLVPAGIRNHFLLAFATIAAAIVIICILALLAGTPIPGWFANLRFKEWEGQQILYFTLLFSVLGTGYFWMHFRSIRKGS